MIPNHFYKEIDEAQEIRNKLLGVNSFSDEEIKTANQILTEVCANENNDPFIVHSINDHEYLGKGLVFSHGWFSNRIQFKNPYSPLFRVHKARVVLFREYFLMSLIEDDPWKVLNQVCDITSIRKYAESGCKEFDVKSKHYFLHSSHTSKFLPKEKYEKIDRDKYTSILYPMYEAEVIGTIVAIIALVLQATQFAKEEMRKKRERELESRINFLEEFIVKQKEISSQMLLEMILRNKYLLDKVSSNDGTITPDELQEIYLDSYLPVMEQLRLSKGEDCPPEIKNEQEKWKKYADEITPRICQGKTKEGIECKRLVPRGRKFCWQHK